MNAFVIHAAQPVVADTGLGLPDRDFLAFVAEVIDPADITWIWLTHPNRDHTGGLLALLDDVQQARVIHHVPRRGDHVHRTPAADEPHPDAQPRPVPRRR